MRPLLDADYSAIEARIVCWLAGQEDALEEIRQGIDRYKVMASLIYNVPVDKVNKHPQRFVGKQTILGFGFGMGPNKFRADCWNKGRYVLPLGLEFTAHEGFQAKHPKLKTHRGEVEKAAKRAIMNKGEVFKVRNVAISCRDVEGTLFLLIKLPSGRKLAYPRPRIAPSKKFPDTTSIYFFGNLRGTNIWGEMDTYGGKLVENITQAVAADIMAQGSHNAERAGYQIAALIHDQALSYYRDGQAPEEFVRLLTDMPPWADGPRIAAEGSLVPFYKKD